MFTAQVKPKILPWICCFLADFFSFIQGYCSCMDIIARGDIPATVILSNPPWPP